VVLSQTSLLISCSNIDFTFMQTLYCLIQILKDQFYDDISLKSYLRLIWSGPQPERLEYLLKLAFRLKSVYCCSNHSSLKDKWFYNEQSSPVGYQVTNGGLQENSTRSPRCIAPLYILITYSPCYNNVFTSCPSTMLLPHVLLLIHMCFP